MCVQCGCVTITPDIDISDGFFWYEYELLIRSIYLLCGFLTYPGNNSTDDFNHFYFAGLTVHAQTSALKKKNSITSVGPVRVINPSLGSLKCEEVS